jgi:hypothetical protein
LPDLVLSPHMSRDSQTTLTDPPRISPLIFDSFEKEAHKFV